MRLTADTASFVIYLKNTITFCIFSLLYVQYNKY